MDDGKTPGSTGPWMDIYQQIGAAAGRGDKTRRVKHFYFDSVTDLPNRVRYLSTTGGHIEVVRSKWTQIQGQYVALQIDRYQDGKLTHSLTGTSAAISAAANDGAFAH
jgi:hypothetical protein